jgi:iron(II)-dependent oxidoreductase
MDLNERIACELTRVRARTLRLLAPLDEADLTSQHSPLMSPLVWDLAHVGNYEDQWLLRALGAPGLGSSYDEIYDAFRHPRRDRPSLPLLEQFEARAYIADVRSRVLDLVGDGVLDRDERLLRDGFVYGMVVQHEHQHDETMLATLQLMAPPGYRPPLPPPAMSHHVDAKEVFVDGGPFVMGCDDEPWAYDNERPAHVVDLDPFWIDATPVTNADMAAFIAGGGYGERRWWSDAGWAWRLEAGLEHPQFWQREGAGWTRDRFGWAEDLAPDEPVQHVCWYEADAYARWAGKRLPNEAEWEKAASWDATVGRKRRYPWGDGEANDELANLGQRQFGPSAVGASPAGTSAYGCAQMVGDVWEWTSSDFLGYPGFVAFPYREYSEVFFGPEYKVLRGGSWATDPTAVRTTFRNWDYPIRRQIFAGFRCARDA